MPLLERVAVALDDGQHLVAAAPADGDDQPAAVGELPQQLRRHLVGGGRHQDALERRVLVPAPRAVADREVHVGVARGGRASRGRAPRAERAARPRRPRPPPRRAPPSGTRCRRPPRAPCERTSTSSSEVMSATMYGCEIVCPSPMGSGVSAYASAPASPGTNRWRGTERMAASTSSSRRPAPHELLLDHAQAAHAQVGPVSRSSSPRSPSATTSASSAVASGSSSGAPAALPPSGGRARPAPRRRAASAGGPSAADPAAGPHDRGAAHLLVLDAPPVAHAPVDEPGDAHAGVAEVRHREHEDAAEERAEVLARR